MACAFPYCPQYYGGCGNGCRPTKKSKKSMDELDIRSGDMGPEQQRLLDRLFNDPNRKLLNFKITRGEQACTTEELCAELNRAFDDVDSGRSKPVPCVDTGMEQINVRDYITAMQPGNKS